MPRRRGLARGDRPGAGAAVDAVVGGRDLALGHGRGDGGPRAVRARQPAGAPGGAGRRAGVAGRGWGRGGTSRCGCARAESTRAASASAWASGRRGIDLDERHDAVMSLEIERWQGLVGPRVSVEAIETLAPRPPLPGSAPRPATSPAPIASAPATCAPWSRRREQPAGPRPAGRAPGRGARPPRRGRVAGRAGGPRGRRPRAWSAVVADVRPAPRAPWRPRWSRAVSEPRWPCWAAPAATRARWRPASRWRAGCRRSRCSTTGGWPRWSLPEGMHLVLVDPPATPEQAAWAAHRAEGRWLHMVVGRGRDASGAAGGRGRVGAAAGRRGDLGRPARRRARRPGGPSSRRSCWATGRSRGRPGSPPAPSPCWPRSGWWRWGSAASARPPTRGRRELEASERVPRRAAGASTRRAPTSSFAPTLDLFALHRAPAGRGDGLSGPGAPPARTPPEDPCVSDGS